MAKIWALVEWFPANEDGEEAPKRYDWVDMTELPDGEMVPTDSIAQAESGATLADVGQGTPGNSWWNVGQEGNTTKKAYSPSGAVTKLVRDADGNLKLQLPADAVHGGDVTDKGDGFGGFGQGLEFAMAAASMYGLVSGASAISNWVQEAISSPTFSDGTLGGASNTGANATVDAVGGVTESPTFADRFANDSGLTQLADATTRTDVPIGELMPGDPGYVPPGGGNTEAMDFLQESAAQTG